ncbi:MAG: PilZ domain-containing protein, partial [bacterium]|nr:PilZ domain-containing protein [bacterium]
MEFTDTKTILKYLNITLLSYSRLCYFIPGNEFKERVKARFMSISATEIKLSIDFAPKKNDGFLMFHSYTYMLRFKARLSSGDQPGTYSVSMPAKIETYDQRKYARLVFESKENKIITVYNKDLKHSIKAILSDISAGGMKFYVIDPNLIPKPGELVVADIQLMGKQIKSFARVVQVHDENVGCSFLDKSNQFQL